MKEIRIDSINDDIVIFAKDRVKRPMDKVNEESKEKDKNEYNKECPFCRGNESNCTNSNFKIEDDNDWVVKSVNNKYRWCNRRYNDVFLHHGLRQ